MLLSPRPVAAAPSTCRGQGRPQPQGCRLSRAGQVGVGALFPVLVHHLGGLVDLDSSSGRGLASGWRGDR